MDVAQRPRLFDVVRTVLRRHHYSLRTEFISMIASIRGSLAGGNRTLSRLVGYRASDIGVDTESGAERAAVSLSASVGHELAALGGLRSSEDVQAPAGRADA